MTTKTIKRTTRETILNLSYCSLKSQHDTGDLHLRVRYEGTDIRRRFKACQRSQAIDLCNRQENALNRSEGLLAEFTGEKVHRHIGLVEAFMQWLESLHERNCSTPHLRNSKQMAMAFCVWMGETYPAIKSWNSLTKKHIQAYHKHLEAKSISCETVRHYLNPISSTATFITRETELPNPYTSAHIVIKAKAKARGKILDSAGLVRFMAWLHTENKPLFDVAMLTAFAGLRVMEATALRYCDVDTKLGTITITDTETHATKNASSTRTIPVCNVLLNHLRAKCDTWTGDPRETICKSHTGLQFNLEGTAYQNAAKRLISKARAKGITPEGFLFRELRACFSSIALLEAEVHETYLQRYVGHSGKTMLQTHYIRLEVSNLAKVVTSKLNVFWQHFGNSENSITFAA